MSPRYILYIHLVMNDIILLTILTLIQVLSYIVYTLNVSLCILLVLLGMAANFNNPMTLAVMALECFVAVCYPLRHSHICQRGKHPASYGHMRAVGHLDMAGDSGNTAGPRRLSSAGRDMHGRAIAEAEQDYAFGSKTI
uniref:G-protein coupled receptors family 1 profile domain-containing protein n=1 Tax=Knipowitschia caucasica TaxID=637954 RepID=A0AAV2M8C1_KNICA